MTGRLYRIAAVLLFFFAVLHTVGFMMFTPPTPEGIAVRDAMTNVHFAGYSYGAFYRGFGLFVTAYLLLTAFLAWYLAKHPIATIGWSLCAVQIASFVLSTIYFSIKPASFSALVAICLGWAAWRSPRTMVDYGLRKREFDAIMIE